MGNFFKFGNGGAKGQPPEYRHIEPVAGEHESPANEPLTGEEASGMGAILRLSSTEVKLLQLYSKLLADDFEDADNPRLYPEAHLENPKLQEEFADLTQQELQTSRLKALNTLTATIAANNHQTLTCEQLGNWAMSLSVLHLALGAKLEAKGFALDDLESVLEDFPDEDDRFELAAYLLMADILEEASRFLVSQLTLEFNERH